MSRPLTQPLAQGVSIAMSSKAPPKQGSQKKKILEYMKKIYKKLDFCIKVVEQQSGTKYVEESKKEESREDEEKNEADCQLFILKDIFCLMTLVFINKLVILFK